MTEVKTETIIKIQKAEIDRLNDNRVYMLALLEEVGNEANTEIGRLNGVISQLMSLVPERSKKQAQTVISGVILEEVSDPVLNGHH